MVILIAQRVYHLRARNQRPRRQQSGSLLFHLLWDACPAHHRTRKGIRLTGFDWTQFTAQGDVLNEGVTMADPKDCSDNATR